MNRKLQMAIAAAIFLPMLAPAMPAVHMPQVSTAAKAAPRRGMAIGSHKVKPGDDPYNNGDVTVTNKADSDGDARVTPDEGNDKSSSTVTTESGFKGSVSGVEKGDTVNLGNNNAASVSTAGGTVGIGSNYSGTISNAPPPNTDSTRIEPPSGEPFSLSPGGSIQYPPPQ